MEEDGAQLTDDPIGDGSDAWPFFATRCAAAGVEVAARVIPGWSMTSADRRPQESAAARELARELLRPHGLAATPLLRHPQGFPLWPDGWVGSLAHSAGWCAVAQGRTPRVRSVGVDIEHPARMQPAMWPHVMSATEASFVATQSELERAARATAIFCAKEALYKALFPLDPGVPGFLDVEVAWSDGGAFHFRPLTAAAGTGTLLASMRGAVEIRTDRVIAVAWVPAGG